MKKGEKPTRAQTATLRTIAAIRRRLTALKGTATRRQLYSDEVSEVRTLHWVLSWLINKSDIDPPDKPEGSL